MNKFILVPKDQFDELKANQMSKLDKPVTYPKNSDNVNTSPDPEERNPLEMKQIRENERPTSSEREEQTGQIRNGSNSGTKISDEENDYLNGIYYNPRSPVTFKSWISKNISIPRMREKK